MPKPQHHINNICLERLKSELELRVGIFVKNRLDSQRMSNEIKDQFGIYVSESTFRRLFLMENSSHSFYINTLDKLCTVLEKGMTWEKYSNNYLNAMKSHLSVANEHFLKIEHSLLFINFENKGWKTILTYFDRIQADINSDNKNYLYSLIGTLLYRIAHSCPTNEQLLYKKLTCHSLVRRSFFEQCADPEFSLPNYSIGLDYYRKSIRNATDQIPNDICFERCMQYLNPKSVLSVKEKNSLFHEINSQFELKYLTTREIHPYNIGRIICIRLIQASGINRSCFEHNLNDILTYIRKQKLSWDGFERRVILFYCMQAMSRVNADENYYHLIEKAFETKYLETSNFKQSLNRFLTEKEPNSIIWYRRKFN